jgi:hypothetical protein
VQRRAARPKITGEDHDFFLAFVIDGPFQADRTQHVAGLDSANGHARCYLGRLIVWQGNKERSQAVHVLRIIKGFE